MKKLINKILNYFVYGIVQRIGHSLQTDIYLRVTDTKIYTQKYDEKIYH